MNFAQEHELDHTLAKVGIFFCLGITFLAFVFAMRALPFSHMTAPAPLTQLGQVISPAKTAPSAAARSAAPAPTPVPTVAATPIPVVTVDTAPPAAIAPSAPASVSPRPQATAVKATPTPVAEDKSYTVQSGDTIYSVARHYGISPAALAASNGLSPTTGLLKVGQPLKIP